MRFEWDEAKRRLNIRKHGIDFEDIAVTFQSPMLTALDTREDYGEDRWIGIGVLQSVVVVVVIFIERTQETIRIISARKATKYEGQAYYKKIKHGLE
jgi:uncharacterized DUF497 family protein